MSKLNDSLQAERARSVNKHTSTEPRAQSISRGTSTERNPTVIPTQVNFGQPTQQPRARLVTRSTSTEPKAESISRGTSTERNTTAKTTQIAKIEKVPIEPNQFSNKKKQFQLYLDK